MSSKFTKLIGIKYQEFEGFTRSNELKLRKAHLIPILKPGDEMALTSVLLSSLRLIKEFRQQVWKDLKLQGGGSIHVFTEVEFPNFKNCRVDGLILIVKSGEIRDAAILEMKSGRSELDFAQIERYIELGRTFNIPKLVTISNQYVSTPSQCPLNLKPKGIELFHLSWTYLLTISHLLLTDKGSSIEDSDQVELMSEVVAYLENEKSGVRGFNQMKKGWCQIADSIQKGLTIPKNCADLNEAVLSWHQEEQDLALALSQKLGVLVAAGNKKYSGDLGARWESDKKKLQETMQLDSSFRIKGAVSDIIVSAIFSRRTVEMTVKLKAPALKTSKGQIGWLKKQIDQAKKRTPSLFEQISKELFLEVNVKNQKGVQRFALNDIEDLSDRFKGHLVKEFQIILIEGFGKNFSSAIKFVTQLEMMAENFYIGIVQHLKKWVDEAPKVGSTERDLLDIGQDTNIGVRQIDDENSSQTEAVGSSSDFDSKKTA